MRRLMHAWTSQVRRVNNLTKEPKAISPKNFQDVCGGSAPDWSIEKIHVVLKIIKNAEPTGSRLDKRHCWNKAHDTYFREYQDLVKIRCQRLLLLKVDSNRICSAK